MPRFAILTLAAFDKQGNRVEGGTAVPVNPEMVATLLPNTLDAKDGLPTSGTTIVEMMSGRRHLVDGLTKDVMRAIQSA